MDELLTPPEEALMCLATLITRAKATNYAPDETFEGRIAAAMVGWADALLQQNKDLKASNARIGGRPVGAPLSDDEQPWMYSSCEEEWSNGSECESREVAVSEALRELDLVAGDRFWTGITDKIDTLEIAESWGGAERMIEEMETHLFEDLGDAVDTEFKTTPAQRDELDQEVTAVVKRWLDRTKLAPQCWRMEKTKSHVVKNCECTKSTPEGLGDDRCKTCGGCGLVVDLEAT